MRPIRLTAVLACLVIATAGCGTQGRPGSQERPAQPDRPSPPANGSNPPDGPTSSIPQPSPPGAPPGGASPTPSPVKPRGDTANPRPVKFTDVAPQQGGRALAITWWSGVEPCHVLDRVDVAYRPDSVEVTLYEGQDPKRPNVPCIEIAVRKKTVVQLESPLGDRKVIDGAQ